MNTKFFFEAKNLDGKIVKGTILALDKDVASRMLFEKDLDVVSILNEKEAKKGFGQDINLDKYFTFLDRVSLKDVVDFSKQMAALMEAGVSVVKALQLMSEGTTKNSLKTVLTKISQDVKTGKSISAAFGVHKNVFSDFYVNLVRTGEESGKMAQSFNYLSEYMDRNYALVVKVRNAMIYPAFVISIFFIVMILVFTLVIPRLAEILKESDVELPLLTRIVLSISDFLVAYGIYFFIVMGIVGTYVYLSIKNDERFANAMDTFKIKMPIIKNVFKMLYVTRIADNIQTLLTSGVSLTKAIQITGDVVGNNHYKNVMQNSLLDVKAGVPLSKSLARHQDLIPPTLVQMLRIGEETGEIGKLMGNIAKFYQREINTTIDTMVGLIEPLMIVLLGLGVGVLLVSVLMPIYNLAGSF
jgi:type IV pilus assembly protein PilC